MRIIILPPGFMSTLNETMHRKHSPGTFYEFNGEPKKIIQS